MVDVLSEVLEEDILRTSNSIVAWQGQSCVKSSEKDIQLKSNGWTTRKDHSIHCVRFACWSGLCKLAVKRDLAILPLTVELQGHQIFQQVAYETKRKHHRAHSGLASTAWLWRAPWPGSCQISNVNIISTIMSFGVTARKVAKMNLFEI